MSTNDDPIAVWIPQPCFKRTHETANTRRLVSRLAHGHPGEVKFEKLTFRMVFFDTTNVAFVKRKKTARLVSLIVLLFENINQSIHSVRRFSFEYLLRMFAIKPRD